MKQLIMLCLLSSISIVASTSSSRSGTPEPEVLITWYGEPSTIKECEANDFDLTALNTEHQAALKKLCELGDAYLLQNIELGERLSLPGTSPHFFEWDQLISQNYWDPFQVLAFITKRPKYQYADECKFKHNEPLPNTIGAYTPSTAGIPALDVFKNMYLPKAKEAWNARNAGSYILYRQQNPEKLEKLTEAHERMARWIELLSVGLVAPFNDACLPDKLDLKIEKFRKKWQSEFDNLLGMPRQRPVATQTVAPALSSTNSSNNNNASTTDERPNKRERQD
jgi:hypothetical protein